MMLDPRRQWFFSNLLVLLCYKVTIWCRIVLWDPACRRQAHSRNALRHTWKAWRKPQGTQIELFH